MSILLGVGGETERGPPGSPDPSRRGPFSSTLRSGLRRRSSTGPTPGNEKSSTVDERSPRSTLYGRTSRCLICLPVLCPRP